MHSEDATVGPVKLTAIAILVDLVKEVVEQEQQPAAVTFHLAVSTNVHLYNVLLVHGFDFGNVDEVVPALPAEGTASLTLFNVEVNDRALFVY